MKNLVNRRAGAICSRAIADIPALVHQPRRHFLSLSTLALPWLCGSQTALAAKPPLKVAFVYVSPVSDAGWTYQHDQGRQEMAKALGSRVSTHVVASVAEGADSERVMRDLASEGYDLIFATSFGYMEPALRVAADFPGVRFEHAGGYRLAPNLSTYNARHYEGRFLAGMLAGGMTKSNTLGYVAGMPIPEVLQGANAFLLGARKVNPQASLRIIWTNTWFDPGRESAAARTLINAGADVLSHHTGSSAVPRTANEAGVWAVAYHTDMRHAAPAHHLVAVTHHWGGYYTERAQAVLDGRWQSTATWGEMADGFVRLEGISDQVPAPLRAQVDAARQAMLADRLSPFQGPVTDSTGKLRIAKNTRLSDGEIAPMDWFAEGVVSR